MTDETRNNISTFIYSLSMLIGVFINSIELILFSGFLLVVHTIKSWNWEQNQVMGDEVKQAYLDGFEQGYEDCRHYAHDYYKPKWHDLRKNPDDLPKDINSFVLNQDGEKCRKYPDLWIDIYGNGVTVIAWCELPIFKEN